MFKRKKYNPTTLWREKLLEHIVELEKKRLIEWTVTVSYRDAQMITYYEAAAKYGDLSMELAQKKHTRYSLLYMYARPPQLYFTFTSLKVSLDGNGILQLNEEDSPRDRSGNIDHRITYLMSRTREAWESQEKSRKAAIQAKIDQRAEQSAQEILSHLSAQ